MVSLKNKHQTLWFLIDFLIISPKNRTRTLGFHAPDFVEMSLVFFFENGIEGEIHGDLWTSRKSIRETLKSPNDSLILFGKTGTSRFRAPHSTVKQPKCSGWWFQPI